MAELARTSVSDKAVDELRALFNENQPVGFIALEMVVSSRVLDAVNPASKLGFAIRDAASRFPEVGFWQSTPQPLGRIIELTDAELRRASSDREKSAVLSSLLNGNPDFLASVRLPEADPKGQV